MLNSGKYHSSNIVSFLKNNGYSVQEYGDYISFPALWRNSNNLSSVSYYFNSGNVIDWVNSEKFNTKELIRRVLGLKNNEEVDLVAQKNNINLNFSQELKPIKQTKIFSDDILKELLPIYDYFLNRGISEEVLKSLKCGLYNGKIKYLNNRIVFPIFNSKNQIVMLAARDITNKNDIYWILKGQKSETVYPAFLNSKDIREKNSVFLVEGISDLVCLMSLGISNILVLFGTELNLSIINYLLKINIDKIYVSTNNDLLRDGENNSAGNDASEKIAKRLRKYFGYNQVKIVLPQKYKDWAKIYEKLGKQEILEQLKEYIN